MKTWEIRKLMDEKGGSMVGRRYKLIKGLVYNCNFEEGDTATIELIVNAYGDNYFTLISDKTQEKIKNLTGFEEWEEIQLPVTFKEVLEAVQRDSNINITLKNEDYDISYRKYNLNLLLDSLQFDFDFRDDAVADILLNSKFYIND